jgi:hypothetical protein
VHVYQGQPDPDTRKRLQATNGHAAASELAATGGGSTSSSWKSAPTPSGLGAPVVVAYGVLAALGNSRALLLGAAALTLVATLLFARATIGRAVEMMAAARAPAHRARAA